MKPSRVDLGVEPRDNFRRRVAYMQQLFDEMEAKGIIAKTGELRPARDGTLQPVYALTQFARALEDAKDGRAPKTSRKKQ